MQLNQLADQGGGTNKPVLQPNEPHIVRSFFYLYFQFVLFSPEKSEPAPGAAKISDAISLKKILYF